MARLPSERRGGKLGRKKTTRGRSLAQEDRLAAERPGASRVLGSGAIPGMPGDVQEIELLWECKTTGKKSYSISRETLKKITREARGKDREPALFLTFEDMDLGMDADWVLIPSRILPQELKFEESDV